MTNSARTPKSPVFWNFAKKGWRKTGPKNRPNLRAWKTPCRKWPDLINSIRFRSKPWQHFAPNRGSKSASNVASWPIRQGHLNHPFSSILQRGTNKNWPKIRPTLGASKTPCRKWPDLIVSSRLKCKPWQHFAPNCGSKNARNVALDQFRKDT